jgi:hypothetical protein
VSQDLHIATTGDEFGLGCNVPEEFPVGGPAVPFKVLTLDQIRSKLAGKPSFYGRRKLFDLSWNSNQRTTNACNGHATARSLSRSIYVKTGRKVLCSGADAYSQMNGNRDAGSSLVNGMEVVARGIATEELVPWDHIFTRQISAEAKADRKNQIGFEPIPVDTEEELATGILLGWFPVVAVQVDRSGRYERVDGDGVCTGDNGPGNHAVGIDDLRLNPTTYAIDFDQYGSWGDHVARTFLQWNRHLRESVRNHRFWLLRSALDDPRDQEPPAVSE